MQLNKLVFTFAIAAAVRVAVAAEPASDIGYCVHANLKYSEGDTRRAADGTLLRCSRPSTLVLDQGPVSLTWQPVHKK
jgi:hypothetical protein